MFNWLRRIISGTKTAWCLRCQAKQKIIPSRRERIDTPKGVSTRQVGTCVVCRGETSSFVKAA
jgi:hypothetical protein